MLVTKHDMISLADSGIVLPRSSRYAAMYHIGKLQYEMAEVACVSVLNLRMMGP